MVAFVLLVAVVGLVTWCGYNRNNKKAKKTICQEVGHEDYSSVDTHQVLHSKPCHAYAEYFCSVGLTSDRAGNGREQTSHRGRSSGG